MSDIPYEFYLQLKHSKLRRAEWHDYHSRGFYLVTLMRNSSLKAPLFSSIIEKNGKATVDFTWAGWGIYNGINKFIKNSDFIVVWKYVIMPDHVHVILEVKERIKQPLGYYVGLLKQQCELCFRSKSMVYGLIEEPAFSEGFNDRILLHRKQLDNWTDYILDNPRRLLIMRSNHNFFSKKSVVRYAGFPEDVWLSGQDPEIQLYGNGLITENPEICAVRFSSKFSAEEWEKRRKEALRVAKNGGVLVSPFIHKEEKAILEEGMLLGAKIIKVIPDGFLDREKPKGADFHHCAEGRMLLAALNRGVYTPTRNSRSLCMRMNRLAAWIAANPKALIL